MTRDFSYSQIYSHLKTLKDREYSFDKLTQLSKGDNGENPPVFNIDGILPGDICVSPIQLNKVILHELNISTTRKS
jgi:hypothetical protein